MRKTLQEFQFHMSASIRSCFRAASCVALAAGMKGGGFWAMVRSPAHFRSSVPDNSDSTSSSGNSGNSWPLTHSDVNSITESSFRGYKIREDELPGHQIKHGEELCAVYQW